MSRYQNSQRSCATSKIDPCYAYRESWILSCHARMRHKALKCTVRALKSCTRYATMCRKDQHAMRNQARLPVQEGLAGCQGRARCVCCAARRNTTQSAKQHRWRHQHRPRPRRPGRSLPRRAKHLLDRLAHTRKATAPPTPDNPQQSSPSRACGQRWRHPRC